MDIMPTEQIGLGGYSNGPHWILTHVFSEGSAEEMAEILIGILKEV